MSEFDTEFELAVEHDMTCSDCKHFQINKRVKNVRIEPLCMNDENKQHHLHGSQPMSVSLIFLCNGFELEIEE